MVRVLFYTSIVSLLISAAFLIFPFETNFLLLAIILLLFIAILIFKKKNKFNHLLLLVVCFFITLNGVFSLNKINNLNKLDGKEVTVYGTITEEATPYNNYCEYIINASKIEIRGYEEKLPKNFKIRITESGDFSFSSFVNVKAKMTLKKMDDDFKSYNFSENIFINGTNAEVISTTEIKYKPIYYPAYLLSKYIKNVLYDNMNYDYASLSTAILLGDRTGLSDEFYDNTKAAGVTHMLVVSGAHLSMLTLVMLKILRKLKVPLRLRSIIMLFMVFMVVAICGFSTSILRAGFTYFIYFIGAIFFRQSDPINSLGTATVIMLFTNPFLFYNVGYLLSYLSTFGVIFFTDKINALFLKIKTGKIIGFVYKSAAFILAQTIAATLTTTPLCMMSFGYVSTIALIANLILNSGVTVILIASALAVLIISVPFLSIFSFPFFFLISVISKYSIILINYFGSLPFSIIETKSEHYVVWALVIAAAFIFYFSRRVKDLSSVFKFLKISGLVSLSLAIVILSISIIKPDNRTKVSLLNVGNGICAFIKYNGTTILVGTGDNDNDEQKISSFVMKNGKRTVDAIIIPKANITFAGGAKATLSNIKANTIISSNYGSYYSAINNFSNIRFFKYKINRKINDITVKINNGFTEIFTPTAYIVIDAFNEYKSNNADLYISLYNFSNKVNAKNIAVFNFDENYDILNNMVFVDSKYDFYLESESNND